MSNSDTNYRLVISYNGSGFRGLAPNPGVRTVVGEIQTILSQWTGYEPAVIMSGRTDAGVHASHQVLNFCIPELNISAEKLGWIISSKLAPEVVVLRADVAPLEFDARHDATGRRYRYLVNNSENADPLTAHSHWHIRQPLDLDEMNRAAAMLIGSHDFTSFCRRPKQEPDQQPASLVRRVVAAEWAELQPGELKFAIAGSAFCHQMVRSIVGFLIGVGVGKRQAKETTAVLEAKDRAAAEPIAPPHGLCLTEVEYQ